MDKPSGANKLQAMASKDNLLEVTAVPKDLPIKENTGTKGPFQAQEAATAGLPYIYNKQLK